MNQESKQVLRVLGGPNKDDLVSALVRKNNDGTPFRVTLKYNPGEGFIKEVAITLNMLELEDGSKESFNFSGYVYDTGESCKGSFNTKSRTGHIRFP